MAWTTEQLIKNRDNFDYYVDIAADFLAEGKMFEEDVEQYLMDECGCNSDLARAVVYEAWEVLRDR